MITLFRRLDVAISSYKCPESRVFAFKPLLFEKDYVECLPMPDYSFIKPTKLPEFLLHVLPSIGRFQTECELLLHPTLRDSFRVAKLVGDEINNKILSTHSNDLMNKSFYT